MGPAGVGARRVRLMGRAVPSAMSTSLASSVEAARALVGRFLTSGRGAAVSSASASSSSWSSSSSSSTSLARFVPRFAEGSALVALTAVVFAFDVPLTVAFLVLSAAGLLAGFAALDWATIESQAGHDDYSDKCGVSIRALSTEVAHDDEMGIVLTFWCHTGRRSGRDKKRFLVVGKQRRAGGSGIDKHTCWSTMCGRARFLAEHEIASTSSKNDQKNC